MSQVSTAGSPVVTEVAEVTRVTDATDDVGVAVTGRVHGRDGFESRRVVCLGLAVLDVVQRVESPPTWGTKGLATSVEIAAGGPATNAAIACAASGVPTTLVTALGSSPQAGLVRAECERFGLHVVDLAAGIASGATAGDAAAAHTSEDAGAVDHADANPDADADAGSDRGTEEWDLPVASCIVDAAGERTVVSTGALTTALPLTPEAESALAYARVLLLDGHHPVAAARALDARPGSCLAVLDAGSAKPHAEPWLSVLDVVAGSADYATGLTLGQEEALAHVLDSGAGAAVMTDGAGPVLWATRTGQAGSYSPPAVRALDTLGAGDAWHGAFVAALALDLSLADAVAYASESASIRVRHQGARGWLAHITRLQ